MEVPHLFEPMMNSGEKSISWSEVIVFGICDLYFACFNMSAYGLIRGHLDRFISRDLQAHTEGLSPVEPPAADPTERFRG